MPYQRSSNDLKHRRWPPRPFVRSVWIALLSLLLVEAAANETSRVYQEADPLVVCVSSKITKSGKAVSRVGTGFFAAPGIIATAAHEIAGAGTISVVLSNRKEIPARLLANDEKHDIALLSIQAPDDRTLRMSTSPPTLGDAVFTIGCPFELEHSLSTGVVSHPARTIDGKELIQLNLSINPGNSGGPLFQQDGTVIGVIHGYLKETASINFAVPIEVVRVLLEQSGVAGRPASASDVEDLWRQAQAAGTAEERVRIYGAIIARAPDLPEAHFNQGSAYFELGQFERARQRFAEAVRQRPGYYQAHTNLGLSFMRQSRHAEARDALLKAISIRPDYAVAYLNLGVVYKDAFHDNESARRAFLRYLELSPDSAEAADVKRWLRELGGAG